MTDAPRKPSTPFETMVGMEATGELIRAGIEKLRRGAPYSVAAVLAGETTPPGMDGARWSVFVIDGRTFGFVNLLWANTNGGEAGMEVDPAFLEREVEFEAGSFPREARIQALLAQGEVAIRPDRIPDSLTGIGAA